MTTVCTQCPSNDTIYTEGPSNSAKCIEDLWMVWYLYLSDTLLAVLLMIRYPESGKLHSQLTH